MRYTYLLRTLLINDFRLIRRDSMLIFFVVIPFVYALLLRWVLPPITGHFSDRFDLTEYYPLIMSYFLLSLPAFIYGVVCGFILIDERDDQTLTAIRVTPLPLKFYLFYRLLFPCFLCIVITLILFPLSGVMKVPFAVTLACSSLACLFAPVTGLYLAIFAANKVTGFALVKVVSVVLIFPVAGYFIPGNAQYLVGICPNYWAVKLFWNISESGSGVLMPVIIGVTLNLSLIWFLMNYFVRKVS